MIKKIKVIPSDPYYLLKIEADSNDGDYIKEETYFTENGAEIAIKALDIILSKLMDSHALESHYSICTFEEEEILDYVDFPRTDWGICHTIENCELFYYDTEGFTYKIELED